MIVAAPLPRMDLPIGADNHPLDPWEPIQEDIDLTELIAVREYRPQLGEKLEKLSQLDQLNGRNAPYTSGI